MSSTAPRLVGFSVGNFRVFKDEEYFDFAPITILTGKNNSGKSSLIKAIRLFSNSIKNNGLYLDFTDPDLKLGSFNEVKNYYNENATYIDFGVRIEVQNDDTNKIEYFFLPSYDQNGLSSFYLGINGEQYIQVTGAFNGKKFKYTQSSIFLDEWVLKLEKLKERLSPLTDEIFNKIKDKLISFLEKTNEMHLSDGYYFESISNQDKHVLFNVIEAIYYAMANISNNKKQITFGEILDEELKDFVDEAFIKENISFYTNNSIGAPDFIPQNLFSCFSDFEILESVRAEQSNFFRYNDNLNLIALLKAFQKLPTIDYENTDKVLNHEDDYSMEKIYINSWLYRFGIIDFKTELQVKPISAGGYDVLVKKNDRLMHLTEIGYGFTQLIPVILKICMAKNKTIIIEEPEANLHPALQSKLADLFYQAAKYTGNQFIIETHSEYLIRKLQYLTAKLDEELNPDDTVIYYFFPPNEISDNSSQIMQIKIQADGSLTKDFGGGFFDEADNIALDIFLLKKSQKN
jgi:predicted ATPase